LLGKYLRNPRRAREAHPVERVVQQAAPLEEPQVVRPEEPRVVQPGELPGVLPEVLPEVLQVQVQVLLEQRPLEELQEPLVRWPELLPG
jgi:hypothetical protein